eukprot:jgi/Orpsp1_1/1174164/evm.model.c7180000049132.1
MNKANIFFLIIIFLLKILGENIDSDIKYLKNNETFFPEKDKGANYFAYSPYRSGYTKISSYIHLPSSLNNGNRNAYISFGVFGFKQGFDVGIKNDGISWYPYYYDIPNKDFKEFINDRAPSETKIVGIEVEVTSDKNILFSLTYRTSDLNNVIRYFNKKLDAQKLFQNDVIQFKFYRFASLVQPVNIKDDREDGTYMLDGKFTGLTIVKDNNPQPWGISGDDIEYAWIVYPSKMEFNYQNGNEYFSINHKKEAIRSNNHDKDFEYSMNSTFLNSISMLILIIMIMY